MGLSAHQQMRPAGEPPPMQWPLGEAQRPIRRNHPGEESTGYINMMSQGEDEVGPFTRSYDSQQFAELGESRGGGGSLISGGVLGAGGPQMPFDYPYDAYTGPFHEPHAGRSRLAVLCELTRKVTFGVCRGVGKLCQRAFVPQVIGIVSGGAVGLFGRQLVLPPETAPLGWLYIGINKLGAAAVPINLILLGAALSKTPARGQLPPLTVAGITVGRMIFMPLCGLGVAKLLAAQKWQTYRTSSPTRSGSSASSSPRRPPRTTSWCCATSPERTAAQCRRPSSTSTVRRPLCCRASLRYSSPSSVGWRGVACSFQERETLTTRSTPPPANRASALPHLQARRSP